MLEGSGIRVILRAWLLLFVEPGGELGTRDKKELILSVVYVSVS